MESRNIAGGAKTYWYYVGGQANACHSYCEANGTWSEIAACLKIKAHRN